MNASAECAFPCHQAAQAVDDWPCLPRGEDMLLKAMLQFTVEVGRPCSIPRGIRRSSPAIDKLVASMGGRRSGGICRGAPSDAWASRV